MSSCAANIAGRSWSCAVRVSPTAALRDGQGIDRRVFVGPKTLVMDGYGRYKRQQRQVAALAEGNTPRNVSPATAAGVDTAQGHTDGQSAERLDALRCAV